MNRCRQASPVFLFLGLLAAVALSSLTVSAEDISNPAAQANPVEESINSPLDLNSPGSVVDRLEEDEQPKEHLFQIPGVSRLLQPWYNLKDDLEKKYGFKYGISYTTFYQKASDSFGPEDDAASYDLDISGTWTFYGRETPSPAMVGFDVFRRDTLGTDIPPQRLFTQYGGLYSGAAPYGEEDLVIGELWLQQKFNNVFGYRIGKIFPITAYDFFPFKNFRTDFVDFNHVTNAAIPLPGNGLGAFVQYRPHSRFMLRLGAHDANADVQESGFDTYDNELFTIFEIGMDTQLVPREPGRPPAGHVHLSFWHQDRRKDAGIDDGQGVAISAVQRFGKFSPFVRYGYADVNRDGPTPVKHMANTGLVVDGIFSQNLDRIGIGYTWSDPADSTLDKQQTVDAYYRLQLTAEIQIGPTFEVIFDPIRNPDEDTIYVWGARARISM